jgi:hypothetical protein
MRWRRLATIPRCHHLSKKSKIIPPRFIRRPVEGVGQASILKHATIPPALKEEKPVLVPFTTVNGFFASGL